MVVSIMLVIDTSGSMNDSEPSKPSRLQFVKKAISTSVDILRPGDKVALYKFSTRYYKVRDFVSSTNSIKQGVNGLSASGGTALFDVIIQAVNHTKNHRSKNPYEPHAIIVLSDGADNSSSHNIRQTINAVNASGLLAYFVYVHGFPVSGGLVTKKTAGSDWNKYFQIIIKGVTKNEAKNWFGSTNKKYVWINHKVKSRDVWFRRNFRSGIIIVDYTLRYQKSGGSTSIWSAVLRVAIPKNENPLQTIAISTTKKYYNTKNPSALTNIFKDIMSQVLQQPQPKSQPPPKSIPKQSQQQRQKLLVQLDDLEYKLRNLSKKYTNSKAELLTLQSDLDMETKLQSIRVDSFSKIFKELKEKHDELDSIHHRFSQKSSEIGTWNLMWFRGGANKTLKAMKKELSFRKKIQNVENNLHRKQYSLKSLIKFQIKKLNSLLSQIQNIRNKTAQIRNQVVQWKNFQDAQNLIKQKNSLLKQVKPRIQLLSQIKNKFYLIKRGNIANHQLLIRFRAKTTLLIQRANKQIKKAKELLPTPKEFYEIFSAQRLVFTNLEKNDFVTEYDYKNKIKIPLHHMIGLCDRFLAFYSLYQKKRPLLLPGPNKNKLTSLEPIHIQVLGFLYLDFLSKKMKKRNPKRTYWAFLDSKLVFHTPQEFNSINNSLKKIEMVKEAKRLITTLNVILALSIFAGRMHMIVSLSLHLLWTGKRLNGTSANFLDKLLALLIVVPFSAPILMSTLSKIMKGTKMIVLKSRQIYAGFLWRHLLISNKVRERLSKIQRAGDKEIIMTRHYMQYFKWLGLRPQTLQYGKNKALGIDIAIKLPNKRIVIELKYDAKFDGIWKRGIVRGHGQINNLLKLGNFESATADQASLSWFMERTIQSYNWAIKNKKWRRAQEYRKLAQDFVRGKLERHLIVMDRRGVPSLATSKTLNKILIEAIPNANKPTPLIIAMKKWLRQTSF